MLSARLSFELSFVSSIQSLHHGTPEFLIIFGHKQPINQLADRQNPMSLHFPTR